VDKEKYGRRADLAKNLCVSPLNKDLSNDAPFSQIHLDGQCLLTDFSSILHESFPYRPVAQNPKNVLKLQLQSELKQLLGKKHRLD
jgi:hypothetical protein